MYRNTGTDTERSLCIVKVLEDIPGGGVVDPDDFKTTTETMEEGTLLGVDSSGIYHIVKTAKLYEDEANDETGYKVLKSHEFVVGDVIVDSALSGKAYAITAINTSNASYDVLTVGTTLGHAMDEGECLVQASAQATSAGGGAYKYTPLGFALNSVDLTEDNQGCGILRRGTVNESLLPDCSQLDDSVKALLNGVILFV